MLLDTIARVALHYLPILIGISAAKRFGVSPTVLFLETLSAISHV